MSPPDFAIFRYQLANSDRAGPVYLVLAVLFAVSIVLSALLDSFWFVPGWFLLLTLVLALLPKSRLCLAPRYLVCGRHIVHYRNVIKLELNASHGILQIHAQRGAPLVIERAHFPTNARKPPKIAANQQAKFDKVTQKIVLHVRAVRPDVTLSGIDPGQA